LPLCRSRCLYQPRPQLRVDLEYPPSIVDCRPRRNGGREYGIYRYPWIQSKREDARGVDLALCISTSPGFSDFHTSLMTCLTYKVISHIR
jgi:hypothetical protein